MILVGSPPRPSTIWSSALSRRRSILDRNPNQLLIQTFIGQPLRGDEYCGRNAPTCCGTPHLKSSITRLQIESEKHCTLNPIFENPMG